MRLRVETVPALKAGWPQTVRLVDADTGVMLNGVTGVRFEATPAGMSLTVTLADFDMLVEADEPVIVRANS
jgi:hypothetical protein